MGEILEGVGALGVVGWEKMLGKLYINENKF